MDGAPAGVAVTDMPPAGSQVRDLLLLGLSVSSGAIDAICFLALGKVFAAFMTGNIVFLGLSVVGTAGAPRTVAVLVSIASFVVGVYLSTRMVRPAQSSGIWPRRVTWALGVSLLGQALFLAAWFASSGQPSIEYSHLLLGLWAFAMGTQSAAVRALHVEGVFTTAATATLILAVNDIANGLATGADRWRHAAVVVALFSGAALGSLLLQYGRLYAPVLPFAITLAVVATAALSFRPDDAL